MNCERQHLRCECGCYATPQSIYLTDEKSMMFIAFCINCEKLIKVFYPIADMFKDCPKPTISAKNLDEMVGKEISRIIRPPLAERLTVNDGKWLVEMHIDPPEEGKLQ